MKAVQEGGAGEKDQMLKYSCPPSGPSHPLSLHPKAHRQHWTAGCPRGVRQQGRLEEDVSTCVRVCVWKRKSVCWGGRMGVRCGWWNSDSASACGRRGGGDGCSVAIITWQSCYRRHTVLKPHARRRIQTLCSCVTPGRETTELLCTSKLGGAFKSGRGANVLDDDATDMENSTRADLEKGFRALT